MKLLVVDGNSILNRAFYGVRPLTTKDGQFTNAIYGFLTMLNKIKADVTPDAVAIAFDLKAPTFRHKAYVGYKAQRKGMPQELASQLAPLKELLTDLGYKLVTCEGYEADDILGTLAKSAEKSGNECIIATGDRDSLQLVSKHISVRLAATKQGSPTAVIYDEAKIMEDYGVTPEGLIEIKAIQGDSSDNIPGVAGIGPKGAGDLIQKYKTVDYIYEHIDELDIKEGTRAKLKASKENAILSRMLSEICCCVPIDTDINSYIVSPVDMQKTAILMTKLELFSLMEKMGIVKAEFEALPEDKTQLKDYKTVEEVPTLERAFLLPVFDEKDISALYISGGEETIYIVKEKDEILKLLSTDIKIISNNSKPLFAYADKNNFEIKALDFDISLAAYLLNPSGSDYSLSRLAEEYGINRPNLEDETAADCTVISLLYDKLNKKIEEYGQTSLLNDMEIPLARVLARMENLGFSANKDDIAAYSVILEEKVISLQGEIYKQVGYEFNINSPKQLGTALFEKLMLPAKKKTKSGYSTNADVLEDLRTTHPVVDMVLEYRTYAKLKSTYCDGLLKVIGDDGRIHSSFNQTETRTGRISSTEPNLQNIPVRSEVGREFRKFFCAKDGCLLVDADYSQIELRVLAHIAHDENMTQAFIENTDIHAITASQVFNMPLMMVTPLMRSRAKAVNFGIVYGIGAFSLAKDIGVSNKEASNYIKSYLAHYKGVDDYMKKTIETATQNGYAETMFGRRRYLPELSAKNKITQAFGQRVARNMPIQGTAADIIKIAMVKVDNRLKAENLKSRLILQIHDELIVEAPEAEAQQVAQILREEMENAVHLNVPLIAEANIGKTWYDAKG